MLYEIAVSMTVCNNAHHFTCNRYVTYILSVSVFFVFQRKGICFVTRVKNRTREISVRPVQPVTTDQRGVPNVPHVTVTEMPTCVKTSQVLTHRYSFSETFCLKSNF